MNTIACDISKLSQIVVELFKVTLVGVKCLDGMVLVLVKFDLNPLLDKSDDLDPTHQAQPECPPGEGLAVA